MKKIEKMYLLFGTCFCLVMTITPAIYDAIFWSSPPLARAFFPFSVVCFALAVLQVFCFYFFGVEDW